MEIQKAQQAGIPTDVRKAEGWGIVTVAPSARVIEPAVIVDPAAPRSFICQSMYLISYRDGLGLEETVSCNLLNLLIQRP